MTAGPPRARLPRPGRTRHQNAVVARRDDLQRPLRRLVTANRPEVRRVASAESTGKPRGARSQRRRSPSVPTPRCSTPESCAPSAASFETARSSPSSRAQQAYEACRERVGPCLRAKLSDLKIRSKLRSIHLPRGGEDGRRDREVEPRPRFAKRAGSEVHHHLVGRHREPAGPDGRTHPLLRSRPPHQACRRSSCREAPSKRPLPLRRERLGRRVCRPSSARIADA